jgi:hypothetical protein
VSAARTVDRELELRERIVFALDELDADDPGSVRWVLEGLLADLDREIDDEGPAT